MKLPLVCTNAFSIPGELTSPCGLRGKDPRQIAGQGTSPFDPALEPRPLSHQRRHHQAQSRSPDTPPAKGLPKPGIPSRDWRIRPRLPQRDRASPSAGGSHGRAGGSAAAARGRRGGGGHQRRAPRLRPAGQAERRAGRRHLPAPRRPPGVRGEPGGVRGAGDAGGGGAAAAPRAVRVGRERGVPVPALPLCHRAHEGRGRAGRRAAQPGARQERGLGMGQMG